MKKYLPVILVAATVVLGTAGYALAGNTPYEALLNSLFLVVLNGGVEPSNALIEIARWTGILFALDIVYTLVETALRASAEDVRVRRRAKRPGAVAVHGDGVFADKLAEALGEDGIRSEHAAAFNAPCQVLLFSTDAQAVAYFNRHADQLARAREVYLDLDRMNPDLQRHANVYPFSMAEVAAQLYWANHPVNAPERIAIVGSGAYAEALLTQALLVNIFDVEGGVRYTLYGDFQQYRDLHAQLAAAVAENADTLDIVDPAEGPWHAHLADLAASDRILLVGDPAENLCVAADLQRAGVGAPLHIRCESAADLGLLEGGNTLAFATSEELCTQAIVIQQRQHDAGKICDISYNMGTALCDGCTRQPAREPFARSVAQVMAAAQAAAQEGEGAAEAKAEAERTCAEIKAARLAAADFSVCLQCPTWAAGWRGLNAFTKQSNYAAAAHDAHRMALLEEEGAGRDSGVAFADLPLDVRDRLQQIEHIRWNRFHRLNNWTYAPGGKNKAARTHHYLVPYAELDRPVKDLDGDSFATVWVRNR